LYNKKWGTLFRKTKLKSIPREKYHSLPRKVINQFIFLFLSNSFLQQREYILDNSLNPLKKPYKGKKIRQVHKKYSILHAIKRLIKRSLKINK